MEGKSGRIGAGRAGQSKEFCSVDNRAPGSSHHGFHLEKGVKESLLGAPSPALSSLAAGSWWPEAFRTGDW